MKKEKLSLTLYMHNSSVKSFKKCLKRSEDLNMELSEYSIKESLGLEGYIYVGESRRNVPYWKEHLNKLSINPINLSDNQSNRAVLILKYRERYFSLPFGYGSHMIDRESIVSDFGLRIAANTLSTDYLKSIDILDIDKRPIKVKQDSFGYSSKDEFSLDQVGSITEKLVGVPSNESFATKIDGSECLKLSKYSSIENIKEIVEFAYENYNSDIYKKRGFDWIDKIVHEKDSELISKLDKKLEFMIKNNQINVEVNFKSSVDEFEVEEQFIRYFIKGTGKSANKNWTEEINLEDYINWLVKNDLNIIESFKKHQIYEYQLLDNNDFHVLNSQFVYRSIITEIEFNKNFYLIYNGNWYKIREDYIQDINSQINSLESSELKFPSFIILPNGKVENEGDYNQRVAQNLQHEFILFDKNFYILPNTSGKAKVEVCDLYNPKSNNFIHVKYKKRGSSGLSHLFSQAFVSSKLISEDKDMMKFINSVLSEIDSNLIIPDDKKSKDFSVTICILEESNNKLVDALPFFSKINLLSRVKSISDLGFTVYVNLVHPQN